MLEIIHFIELKVFFFINSSLSNVVLDRIFIFFHNGYKNQIFISFILIAFLTLLIFDKKNRLYLILCIPIGILLTDQIGRQIKNLELRDRPYMTINEENIKLLVKVKKNIYGDYVETSSSKKSFPSNHSANIFFLSYIFSIKYSRYRKYTIFVAFLVAISRIYVGVHYPLDVIFGSFLGVVVGYLLNQIWNKTKLIR
tara:strand:- start:1949 stop:2539 length:591 start_codon:yes stop_codon:yes gene_type:complete